MKEILSKNNPVYKEIKKLSHKKYRDLNNIFVVEGENLVQEALDSNSDLKYIVLSKDYQASKRLLSLLNSQQVSDSSGRKGIKEAWDILKMDNKLFASISDTENSQGILALVAKPAKGSFPLVEGLHKGKKYLILDKLQDPGNTGSLIRTAEACGYDGVILIKGTVDIYSPKVVRAAAGTILRMPFYFMESSDEFLKVFKESGISLISTSMEGDKDYREIYYKKPFGLIMGNEGGGVDPYLLEKCDLKVKIPMEGKIESLNVAVAGGIIMYESVRDK